MANRYARPVGGNWTDNATWSTTSGGAADTVAPTASDDVFLDANSGNVTISATSVGKSLDCTGYTGTLTHNAFTLTLSGSATFVAGMTYTPLATSTIALGASATLTTNGKLMPNVTQTGGTLTLGDNLSFMDSKVLFLSIGSGGADFNSRTVAGFSKTSRVLIRSNTLGTARTVTITSASANGVDFRDISASGAWDLSAASDYVGDCGGNTNITFTTAATQTYTGGTGSWSDASKWTSRVPLPQDDVSMSGVTGGTITADMPRLGKSIDWTGAAGSPTFTNSLSTTQYGSLTLISAMTFTFGGSPIFEGRGSFTLTSAGKSFGATTTFQGVGGTMTLTDAFTETSGTTQILSGSFDTGGFSMSCRVFNFSSASGTLNLNASVITVAGSTGTLVAISGGTVNAGTSTILISDTGASSKSLSFGGKTYYDLKIAGGGAGAIIITGTNTFNRIYTDGGGTKTITFTAGTTQTIASGLGLNNGTNIITLNATAGTVPILAKSGGGTVDYDYINLQGVNASPANTWYTGTHSVAAGKALAFDGASAVVTRANDAAANQISGSTAFSGEAWAIVRSIGENNVGRFFDKGNSTTAPTAGYVFFTSTTARIGVSIGETTAQETRSNPATSYTFGALNHFVWTWASGAAPKLYVNGVETSYTASATVTTPSDDSAITQYIGNYADNSRTFDGQIFATRIYRNVNLSAANVTTLYNAGFKAANPLGNATQEYLFNDGTGTTLTDSISGNNATITSGALWANTGWGFQAAPVKGGVGTGRANRIAIGLMI